MFSVLEIISNFSVLLNGGGVYSAGGNSRSVPGVWIGCSRVQVLLGVKH